MSMFTFWKFTFEAFKFHKLKAQVFLRIGFVLLIILRFLASGAPVGDRNFSALTFALKNSEQVEDVLAALSPGNYLIIVLYLASLVLAFILSFMYSHIWVLENTIYLSQQNLAGEDKDLLLRVKEAREQVQAGLLLQKIIRSSPLDKQGKDPTTYIWQELKKHSQSIDNEGDAVAPQWKARRAYWQKLSYVEETPFSFTLKSLMHSLGQIFLYLLCLGLVYLVSTLLWEIPYYIFVCAFLFAPFYFLQAQRFVAAMRESYQDSRGLKFFIFGQYVFLNLIFSLAEYLSLSIFIQSPMSFSLLESLLFAVRSFVSARFVGIMLLISMRPLNSKIYLSSSL